MPTVSSPSAARPLVELQLDTTAFAAEWSHCDQAANYLAQLVGHDRPDSFLYGNLLSTVLNELLEVVFSRHQPTGLVKCVLSRRDDTDRVELTIPVDVAAREFYERSVAIAREIGVAEIYARELLAREQPEHSLGFLELAADYGAQISVASAGPGEICLVLEVRLEDGGVPATA